MRRFRRLTVLACAAALALTVVAIAAASYTPSMGIFQATYKPSGAGAVTIVVAQETADDPTARIVIYSPPGYKVNLSKTPGTTIGDVIAHVKIFDLSTNTFTLSGAVKADNPANYPAASNPCTPGAAHEAVWTLNAALPSQPANPIPVYVDHTTGSEASIGSAKMTVCFRDPNLPASDPRRSPNGTKFVDAAFTVKGVFTNTSQAGEPAWRSIFTPYTPGTGVPNAAGTREAQGLVPMPYGLSMKRIKARRGFIRFAGTLNVAGKAPTGASVVLFAAVKKRGKALSFRSVAAAKTKRGKYVFNRRAPSALAYYFVERPPVQLACLPAISAAPCTAAIESNAISRVIRVSPPRRR
jgi:hypothetical protein